ncbi:MAG: putative porin [Elusimicrobia bacterium]|nr:putative porin [Elusimicrobiota bacterium]
MNKTFAIAILTAVLAAPASAQLDKLKLSEQIQSIKFAGDLRLRDDVSAKRGTSQVNRGRLRYRLRFGSEIELPNDLLATIRLGSGTGEQVSTNQSADNLSSQKAIWIDLVGLRWKPNLHDNATTIAHAGRIINPLWRTYSSDIVWDDDFNPEGFGENFEWVFPDAGASVFVNGLQAVTDEDSNSGKNQWVFSQQLGVEKTLPLDSRLRLAGAYHKWSDENRSDFGQTTVQDGNRRSNATGRLVSQFRVGEVTGQFTSWIGKLPVNLQATLIRNWGTAHNDLVQGPVGRDGYQYGLIVGAAKAKGQWEAAYFKKYSQIDSTVADVADSDFGDGGTNRVGHIAWIGYAPRDWMLLKVKGFVTDTLDRGFPTVAGVTSPTATTNLDKAINRLQVDMSIKF